MTGAVHRMHLDWYLCRTSRANTFVMSWVRPLDELVSLLICRSRGGPLQCLFLEQVQIIGTFLPPNWVRPFLEGTRFIGIWGADASTSSSGLSPVTAPASTSTRPADHRSLSHHSPLEFNPSRESLISAADATRTRRHWQASCIS